MKRLLIVIALFLLPFTGSLAQEADAAKSNLKAAETLADELQKSVDGTLGGFSAELTCQAQCQFMDSAGVCQRKLQRVDQQYETYVCSLPYYGTYTRRQNIDVYMCNSQTPREDWTITSPCQLCTQTVSYYCSGTNRITRTTCAQTGQVMYDSPPDVDHPDCGCASTYQGFNCSGSTGVYTNYCSRDGRVVSESYQGSHPSCVPPPMQATLQGCSSSWTPCGKYLCYNMYATMRCSGLAPGQSCTGEGTFYDGYILMNSWYVSCVGRRGYGCCNSNF